MSRSRANNRHRKMVLLLQGRPGSPLHFRPKQLRDWKLQMEGREDPYQHLVDSAAEAADAMQEVINRWESGDLAGAVRCLDPVQLRAAATLLGEHLKQNVRNRGQRLEMHHHPNRTMSDYDKMFVLGGQGKAEDGHIEVDSESYTTGSDDDGEYVMAWLWVPNEDVVLRTRHRAHLYYQDEDGAKHHIANDSCLAFDHEEAQRILLDRHWDSRLDSASCIPVFEWDVVELQPYDIEVHGGEGVYDEHKVFAATPEDAIAALHDLYPDGPGGYKLCYPEFETCNSYDCEKCHHAWVKRWSGPCSDTCPKCGENAQPYLSEED